MLPWVGTAGRLSGGQSQSNNFAGGLFGHRQLVRWCFRLDSNQHTCATYWRLFSR